MVPMQVLMGLHRLGVKINNENMKYTECPIT